MKNQALFSSKDKSKELKCCLLQFLFGTLRVNFNFFFIFNLFLYQTHISVSSIWSPVTDFAITELNVC